MVLGFVSGKSRPLEQNFMTSASVYRRFVFKMNYHELLKTDFVH